MNNDIIKKLDDLSKSKFRSKFHLKERDKAYVLEKGIPEIKEHAYDFITKRLAPAYIPNDGSQTPTKNHPVFIAQHATGTCCRKCLYKWHKIAPNRALTSEEIDYIVDVIMAYINKEMEIK